MLYDIIIEFLGKGNQKIDSRSMKIGNSETTLLFSKGNNSWKPEGTKVKLETMSIL